jgi:hypothetical protein
MSSYYNKRRKLTFEFRSYSKTMSLEDALFVHMENIHSSMTHLFIVMITRIKKMISFLFLCSITTGLKFKIFVFFVFSLAKDILMYTQSIFGMPYGFQLT